MNPDYSESIPKTDWSKIPVYDHYPHHKITSPETPESCCDGGRCHPDKKTSTCAESLVVSPVAEAVTSRSVVLESLPYGSDAFKGVLAELWELHCRKGFDYGTDADSLANIRSSAEFGVEPWRYAMLRANEKVSRLKRYSANRSLANESVEDSLLDLASQAILALVLLRE